MKADAFSQQAHCSKVNSTHPSVSLAYVFFTKGCVTSFSVNIVLMVRAQHSSPGLSVCIEFTSVIFQFPFPNDRTFFFNYAVFFYVEFQNISSLPTVCLR